jgi:hypothetical protein
LDRADTGYTNDPSEVTVWWEDEEGITGLVFRLHTEHVSYPILLEIIALVDRYYDPRGIGIDNGGNGLSVVQDLATLDKFRGRDFESKVRGIDFGGATVIGYEENDRPIRKRKSLWIVLELLYISRFGEIEIVDNPAVVTADTPRSVDA